MAAASRRRHRRRQRTRWRTRLRGSTDQDDGRSQRKKEEGRDAWRERRETGAFGAQGWRRVRSRIRYLARDNHLNERIELLERPATPAHPHAEAREGGGRTCEKRARHALAWRWLSDGSGERLAGVGLRERMPGDGVVQPRPSTPIVDHDGRCEEEEAAANAPRVRTSTPGVEVATSTGVAGVTLCFYQIIDRSNG